MPLSTLSGLLLALWIADPFSYSYNSQTAPNGEAEIVLTANENIGAFEVTISGGKKVVKKSVKGLKAGQTYKIHWVQGAERVAYDMQIEGAISGSGQFEVSRPSAATVVGGGKIEALFGINDVRERNVAYRLPFDVESYTFQVIDTDGNTMHEESGGAAGKAGDRLSLRWENDAEVFMLKLSAVGTGGQTAEDIKVTWSVDIPHTNIKFDSGKAVIRGDQEKYVEEAAIIAMYELAGLEKTNKVVGADLTAQLYIIGYTDTVGKAGKNKKLSNARAKAIAEYFKKKGVWCEIYYAGMGESGLLVKTGDNVDEERNRRAAYIMGPQKPAAGGPIPSKWKQAASASARPSGELPPYPEKYREERDKRKFGTKGGSSGGSGSSGSSGGSGGGSGSAPSDDDDDFSYSAGSDGYDEGSNDGAEGPSEVEGTPGASAKGCAVADDYDGTLAIGLLAGLWGFTRRRRFES